MKGRSGLITAAMLVAGIRIWMQLRGKTKTPFNEWVIGWGATFFVLSLLSEASPEGAAALAWIVAVSDFLINGVSLTTDVSNAITSAQKGNAPSSTFVAQPFTPTPTPGKVPPA